MHLDGTWSEIFERGAQDLVQFIEEHEPDVDAGALTRTWLDRRRDGFTRARETMREITAEDSMRWSLARAGISDPSPALLTGAIDAFFAYEEAHWFAYPEAIPVLRTLSDRGLRLGMFSNATHEPLIQRLVDRFGFRPWLDPALSSASTGIRKPDPGAFAPILEAWGLPPASVMMVGDTLDADILGAQRAGMPSVWVRSREDARQEGAIAPDSPAPASPDATIEQLGELPGCLLAL
jgi:HAD superfamily hydrolase (TIGR01549 family)